MLSINPNETQVILMGASEFKSWPQLLAVKNNINKLKELFADKEILGIPDDNIKKIVDESSPCDVIKKLIDLVSKGLDTLIIYYAGHGALGGDYELYLVTKNTDRDCPEYTALAFETIKKIVMDQKFREVNNTIFILDCCFSGGAIKNSKSIEGKKVFIMTATSSTKTAISPPKKKYTAFTDELINVLSKGIENLGEKLTLGEIFQYLQTQFTGKKLSEELQKKLKIKEYPVPDVMSSSGADHLEIVYNQAYQVSKSPAYKSEGDTYVSNYQCDLFVSFAQVDNELLPGMNEGWVTTLINQLELKMSFKEASVWRDNDLGDISVTPETIGKLQNSATLLLILSPGYSASKWCVSVLQSFLEHVGKNSGRVFIIQRDIVEQCPEELNNSKRYEFYKQDNFGKPSILGIPKPDDEYSRQLDCLAIELTCELDKLQKLETQKCNLSKTSI